MTKETDGTTPIEKTVEGADAPKTPTVEELQADLAKKEKIAKDKHDFALSEKKKREELETELEAFRAEKQKKAEEELLAKGEFDTLRKQLEDAKTELSSNLETVTKERDEFKTRLESIEQGIIDDIVASIPDDKRELANDLVSAYAGQEKIEKLKKLAETFKVATPAPTYGGVPEAKAGAIPNRFEELKAKIAAGTITQSEMSEYRTLKSK